MLDCAEVLTLASKVDGLFSLLNDSVGLLPAVVPNGIVDANGEVVWAEVQESRFYLQLCLGHDHVLL